LAITITLAINTNSNSNAETYASGSFTPAAGDFLVVFVSAKATVAAGALTDSQGIGFTRKDSAATTSGGAATIYCFYANGLAANSSMTVTFDCTGDQATQCSIVVVRIAGSANTIAQSKPGSGAASSTPAIPFDSAPNANSAILASLFNNNGSGEIITEPSGYTEDVDFRSTENGGIEVAHKIGSGTQTVTWGSASTTSWAGIIAEVAIAAAAGGPADPFGMRGFFGI
jgi:hypothetical protein